MKQSISKTSTGRFHQHTCATKKEAIRILSICLASIIMATNIKTFVQTGNLIPGGATGLTILIQRALETFFQLHIPYTILNFTLNS